MAKTVYQGGASIDENGKAYGGKAGNQTGRELRKAAWYLHSKDWYVLRAKNPAVAVKIAAAMRAAVEETEEDPVEGDDEGKGS